MKFVERFDKVVQLVKEKMVDAVCAFSTDEGRDYIYLVTDNIDETLRIKEDVIRSGGTNSDYEGIVSARLEEMDYQHASQIDCIGEGEFLYCDGGWFHRSASWSDMLKRLDERWHDYYLDDEETVITDDKIIVVDEPDDHIIQEEPGGIILAE